MPPSTQIPVDFWEKVKRKESFPIEEAKNIRHQSRSNSNGLSLPDIQAVLDYVSKPSSDDSESRLIFCQALKYGIRFNGNTLVADETTPNRLLKAVEVNQDNEDILSELTYSLAYLLKADRSLNETEPVTKCLKIIKSNSTSGASKRFLTEIVPFKHVGRNISSPVPLPAMTTNRQHQRQPKSETFLTRTMQLSRTQTKRSISEKSSIILLNLTEALKKKEKLFDQTYTAESIPTEPEDTDGNNRSILRSTLKEVKHLLTLVKGGSKLKSDDKDGYLVKKYFEKLVWFGGYSEAMIGIAETFSLISKKQRLSEEAQRKLYKSLNKDDDRMNEFIEYHKISENEMEEIRQWAMQAIYNCCLRDIASQQIENGLEIIKAYTNSPDPHMNILAWKIVLLSKRDDAECEQLFTNALDSFEQNNDGQIEQLCYINQQTRDVERCRQLFTPEVISRLVTFAVLPGPMRSRTLCAEIVNNTLEQLSDCGLSDVDLNRYGSLLNVGIAANPATADLRSEMLRGVLLTFENQQNRKYEEDFLQILLENFHHFQVKSSCLTIMALCKLCNNGQNRIPKIGKLAEWINSDLIIVEGEDRSINFEPYSTEIDDGGLKFISSAVGTILLEVAKQRNVFFPREAVESVLKALETSLDKQTRILGAECIYELCQSNSTDWLDNKILVEMDKFLNDSVIDVEVFMRLSFAKRCWTISTRNCQVQLLTDHVLTLLQIFCKDSMILNNKDYAKEFNEDILDTVKKVVLKTEELDVESVNILTNILAHKSEDFYRNTCLRIFFYLVKIRNPNLNLPKLPKSTISVIESLLDPLEPNELVWNILSSVVQNEQPVSESTLDVISDKLFKPEESDRADALKLLKQANLNQDLPEPYFVLLEMEILAEKCDISLEGLKFIEKQVKRGTRLSLNVFDSLGIHVVENEKDWSETVLNVLTSVAENSQVFPAETIRILVESFDDVRDPEMTIKYSQLFRMIQKNYQEIPQFVWNSYEKKLKLHTEADVFEEILRAFLIRFQLGGSVDRRMRAQILERVDESGILKQECIRSVVSMIEADHELEFEANELYHLKNILKRALQTKNDPLVSLAVTGFQTLLTLNPMYLDNEDNSMLLECCKTCRNEKIREKITSILSRVQYEMEEDQQEALKIMNPEESEYSFMKALEKLKNGQIPESCLIRLGKVFDTDLPDSRLMKLRILKLIHNRVPLPDWLIEKLGNFYSRTKDSKLKNKCKEVIHMHAQKSGTLTQNILTICFQNFSEFENTILLLNPDSLPQEARLLVQVCKLQKQPILQESELEVLLEGMMYQVRNSVRIIDEALVIKLVQLSEASSPAAQFLISEILAIMHSNGYVLEDDKPRVLKTICSCIIGVKQLTIPQGLSRNILNAFRSLLNQNMISKCDVKVADVVESLCTLATSYPSTRTSIFLELLECLLDIFKILPNAVPTMNLFSLLETNLTSKDHILRGLSFQCLKLLSRKRTWRSTEYQKVCLSTYNKLQDVAKHEKKNVFGELNDEDLRLVATATSVKHLDLGLIRSLPQENWISNLTISSIAEHFGTNQIQMAEIKLCLDKLQPQLDSVSEPQAPASTLSNLWCAVSNPWRSSTSTTDTTEKKSLEILELLNYVIHRHPCTLEQFLDVLMCITEFDAGTVHESLLCPGPEWYEKFKMLLIQKRLDAKLQGNNLESTFVKNLARGLMKSFSYTEVANLLSKLEAITDIAGFEGIINFCEKHKISKPTKCMGQEEATFSLSKLKSALELKVLLDGFQLSSRILNYKWKRNISSLMELGYEFSDLNKIILLQESKHVKNETERRTVASVIQMLADYKVPTHYFTQVINTVKNKRVDEWICEVNQVILPAIFAANSGNQKTLQEVLDEVIKTNPDLADWIQEKNIVEKVKRISSLGSEAKSEKQIKEWVKTIPTQIDNENYAVETMKFIQSAMKLKCGFHLNSAQILSSLISYLASERSGDNKKGHLQQVVTGTGKSAIIATVAILHGLRGKKVDIVTSNPVLAARDAKDFKGLYSLFGLRASVNTEKTIYTRGPKACYSADIVYGDSSNFQFDILLDEYCLLETLGGRYQEEPNIPNMPNRRNMPIALVDEVDSMLIDNNSKVARLASFMPGFDQFQMLYHCLWNELTTINQRLVQWNGTTYLTSGKVGFVDGRYQLEILDERTGSIRRVLDLEGVFAGEVGLDGCSIQPIKVPFHQFLKTHLTDYIKGLMEAGKIRIPKHMNEFATDQLDTWVENVMIAYRYKRENVQYIVHDGEVKPVNFDSSGIVELFTRWSGGLHQFLQLKHNLKVTPETLTSNYLSSIDFFSRYKSNLYGFTGTLGSDAAKKMLASVFNVDFCYIPDLFKRKYYELRHVIVSTQQEWIFEIIESAKLEVAKKRGVLIICETIEIAKLLVQELKSVCIPSAIKEYTQNDIDQEKLVERIFPGEFIVATNLAGRGTDIRADELERYGGLHVMLTFLPNNLRVWLQNIGRTARQGRSGTSQLIFWNQLGIDLTPENLMKLMDDQEAEILAELDVSTRKMESELFKKFCKLLNILRNNIRNKEMTRVRKLKEWKLGQFATSYETAVVSSVEEEWAILINKIKHGKIQLDQADAEYARFEAKIAEKMERDDVISSPFYYITLADELFINDSKFNSNLSKAERYYEKAIQLDPEFAAAAYVGKANCLLKRNRPENYKKLAIVEYEKALRILYAELAELRSMYAMLMNRTQLKSNNDLSTQLVLKQNILTMYIDDIRQRVFTVEKSLRFISLRCSRKHETHEFNKLDKEDCSRKLMELENGELRYNKYEIEFNSLTVSHDAGSSDQALKTIHNSVKVIPKMVGIGMYNGIQLHCMNIKPKNLTTFFNPDVTERGLTKDKALEMLDSKKKWYKKILPLFLDNNRIDIQVIRDPRNPDNFELIQTPSFAVAKVALKEISNADNLLTFNLVFKDFNDLSREFRNVRFQLGMLDLKSDAAKDLIQRSTCDSIVLDVVGNAETLTQIARKYAPKKILAVQVDEENNQRKYTQIIINREDRLEEKVKFIKVFDLNKDEASEICISNPKSMFSLEFVNFDIQSLRVFAETLSTKIRLIINFSSLSKDAASKLVPILKNLNIDFSLIFQNLKQSWVRDILNHAVMEQENIRVYRTTPLSDNYNTQVTPTAEIDEFRSRGINLLVQLQEQQPIPWISIGIMAGLAVLQLAVGGLLISTGFGATVGLGIVTEGAADFLLVYRSYVNREVNWEAYGYQKAISLTISATTMGWANLKDAGKGVQTLLGASITETLEQSATRVICNFKSITTQVIETGTTLTELAWKEMGWSVGKMAVREAAFGIVGHLSDWSSENILKPQISSQVRIKVFENFHAQPLRFIVAKIIVLDDMINEPSFQRKCEKIVNDLLSREKDVHMEQAMSGLFEAVSRFIFSNAENSNSGFSLDKLLPVVQKIITASSDVARVVNRVCEEISKKLVVYNRATLDNAHILEKYCHLTLAEAADIGDVMEPFDEILQGRIPIRDHLIPEAKREQVSTFLRNYKDRYEEFQMDNVCLSTTLASVSNKITANILSIIDRKMLSPATGLLISAGLEPLMANFQHYYLCNPAHNTADYARDQEKLFQLTQNKKNGLELSKDDTKFMETHRRQNTVADQIRYTAKDYKVAYTQQEILYSMLKNVQNKNTEFESREIAAHFAITILKDKRPAGLTELSYLAKKHDLDLVITDSTSTIPAGTTINETTTILVFFKGESDADGKVGFGRYKLRNPDNTYVDLPSSSSYAILEHLTGIPVSDLRSDLATAANSNPEQFVEALRAEQWIRDRHPIEANAFLFQG